MGGLTCAQIHPCSYRLYPCRFLCGPGICGVQLGLPFLRPERKQREFLREMRASGSLDGDTFTDTHADPDADANPHTDSDPNSDTDTDTHTDSDTNPHTDSDPNSDTDTHTDSDSNPDTNA